jgi:hypothetical protein
MAQYQKVHHMYNKSPRKRKNRVERRKKTGLNWPRFQLLTQMYRLKRITMYRMKKTIPRYNVQRLKRKSTH